MSEHLMIRPSQKGAGRFFATTRCRGSRCTAKSRAPQNDPIDISSVNCAGTRSTEPIWTTWPQGEEIMIEIRKTITLRETVFSELGVEAARPISRAVGMAVIRNPFAGQFIEDLRPLFEAGAMLGERLMPGVVKLLDGPTVSYGKGAIVGITGEMEHGGACVHPMLGKPMRAAMGGGKAVIGSNVKVAAAGALLDVPLGHKCDSWSFPHFDTITVSVGDSPRPAQILVVRAVAVGGGVRNGAGTEPIR